MSFPGILNWIPHPHPQPATIPQVGDIFESVGYQWIVTDITPNSLGRIPVRNMVTGIDSHVAPAWFSHSNTKWIGNQITIQLDSTTVPVKKKRRQVSMNGRDWVDYDKMDDPDPFDVYPHKQEI